MNRKQASADLSPGLQGLPPGWFDYDLAFSRNIGWFTEWEQQKLRASRIAIAGMGGVGGVHMLTLARLGIEHYSIADFDKFEVGNFNRQAGASARTLGMPKAESVALLAREINPDIKVRMFEAGVNATNLDAFLDGADAYIDGLDFFVLDIRRKLFALARQKGIPAITAAPMGMGTGFLIFTADSMKFDDYFGFQDGDSHGNNVRFLLGLTPAMLHRQYLRDSTRVDMPNKRGPSTTIACQLCAGVAAAETVKLILNRGTVKAAPYYHHFDPYRGQLRVRKLRWGLNGPWIGVKRKVIEKLAGYYSRRARPAEAELSADASEIEKILDVARWAPSPDNSQPWRFEILGPLALRMKLDLEEGNPYAFDHGRLNWLAAGMMLEAMRLAATEFQYDLHWQRRGAAVEIEFLPGGAKPDALAHFIKVRFVDRSAYRMTPLTDQAKAHMAAACGSGFQLNWLESLPQRIGFGRLAASTTRIRMQSEACHAVHQRILDPSTPFSRTGLPVTALGINPLSQHMIGWGLQSWANMEKLNRLLLADRLAGIEMDLVTAVRSAGFVLIEAEGGHDLGVDDQLIGGGRIYRLWLEATRQGLALQPACGPLFARSIMTGGAAAIDSASAAGESARHAWKSLQRLTATTCDRLIFAARVGIPRRAFAQSRSIREPLTKIIVNKP